jgi:hypothetical protein
LTVVALKFPVKISKKLVNQQADRMIQLQVRGFKLTGKDRLISPLIKDYLEENQLWNNFNQQNGFERISQFES